MQKKEKSYIMLKKLRNKIWINDCLKICTSCLLFFSIAFLIISTVSHLMILTYFSKKIITLGFSFLCLGIAIGIIKKPSIKKTALIGDKMGFKDRLITYLEYKDVKDDIINIFKSDLEEKIKEIDILKKYKLQINFKKLIISIVIFTISMGITFIPSTKVDMALEKENINKEIKKEALNINKLKKNIKQLDVKEDNKKKLLSSFDEVNKDLNKSLDYNKTSKSIEKLENDINKYSQDNFENSESKNINKNINNMVNQNLSENEILKKIKSDLESKGYTKNQIEKVIKESKKTIKNSKIASSVKVKLKSMKERMASKGSGFESFGHKKGNSFVKGNNKSLDNGEKSNEKSNEKANVNNINKNASNQIQLATAKKGNIERYEKALKIMENKKEYSYVNGKLTERGDIKNTYTNVNATKGENNNLNSNYVNIQKSNMKYIDKDEIPLENKEMIQKYFEKLNGGN